MALQAVYKYKVEVSDCATRRREGMQAKAEFPAKVPVYARSVCLYMCVYRHLSLLQCVPRPSPSHSLRSVESSLRSCQS